MRLDYESDSGAGGRARLGLLVLHVDETVEPEFQRLVDSEGVAVYCSRIESGLEVTPDSLEGMAARIPQAARLLPSGAPMDVVGYACTSGATFIGPERVAELIRAARAPAEPGSLARAAVTDPLTALLAWCRVHGIQRLGFVSPYIASVSARLRARLGDAGLTITAFGSFEQAAEQTVARIAPSSIGAAAERVGRAAPCDAVFVSCTNARTLDILDPVSQELGVPVISSNQLLAWHMLRLVGIDVAERFRVEHSTRGERSL